MKEYLVEGVVDVKRESANGVVKVEQFGFLRHESAENADAVREKVVRDVTKKHVRDTKFFKTLGVEFVEVAIYERV